MVAELQQYKAQIAAIEAELNRLIDGLTEAQLAWRPVPGYWSILECLTHLNLFGQQVEQNLTAMIEEAKAQSLRSAGPYRHPLFGRFLIWLVEPPYRIRVKAVKRLVPMADPGPSAPIIAEFRALQQRLGQLLLAADGLDLAAVKRPLPPANQKISLGQWFAVCLAHERRHLWQAGQIRNQAGFPAAKP